MQEAAKFWILVVTFPVPQELGIQSHPLAKFFWTKLIRSVQIWLDLGEIWAKLRQNLG